MMMHLATLVCFYISATSAVKHYGMIPSEDAHSTIEEHAKKLLNNDMRLVSVFMTDNHHTHDGSDFLSSEMGIFNKMVSDIFTLSIHSSIEARSPVNGQCQSHGKIQDDLSEFQLNMACGAISQAAAGSVHIIISVIESKVCTEAGTGHPLPSCQTVIGLFKVSGSGFTGAEVLQYCPNFLSLFVGCKGSNYEAYAENKNIEITAFNTQKDYNCDNADKTDAECIESTVG